jgi:DNA-binding transcriptional ArsR family regulator
MAGMSDVPRQEAPAAAGTVSSTPEPRKVGSPLEVLKAITDPMRHAVLRELADGAYPPLTTLARKLDCHPDMMGRHLQRMKKAGLVIRVRPEDSDLRAKYFQIPAEFRSTHTDGRRVLDFGCVVLRFEPG